MGLSTVVNKYAPVGADIFFTGFSAYETVRYGGRFINSIIYPPVIFNHPLLTGDVSNVDYTVAMGATTLAFSVLTNLFYQSIKKKIEDFKD